MRRKHRCGRIASARASRRGPKPSNVAPQRRLFLQRVGCADRKSLLLGTALTPSPAQAAVTCPQPPGGPIAINTALDSINCVNVFNIYAAPITAIDLQTSGANHFITLDNRGNLSAGYFGIRTFTNGVGSYIDIVNSGDIVVGSVANHYGIYARTLAADSPIAIENSGDIDISTTTFGFGIRGSSQSANSPVAIMNSGDISSTAQYSAYGIFGGSSGANSPVAIENSGDIAATSLAASGESRGIDGLTFGANSPIAIENHGDITSIGTGLSSKAYGIEARAYGANSPIAVENSGNMLVNGGSDASGIFALSQNVVGGNGVSVENSGDMNVIGIYTVRAIVASGIGPNSPTSVVNSGNLVVTSTTTVTGIDTQAKGIYAGTNGANSPLNVINSGGITATGGRPRLRHRREHQWGKQSTQHRYQRRHHGEWNQRRRNFGADLWC
jgi:hypothetical protein